jgi:cell fate regulator YaaT (PSP1 superfamily)
VETARGVEYGTVVMPPTDMEESEINQPLKPVMRKATNEDSEKEKRNREKEKDAFKICKEKIAKHGLDMKLIDAEYTFDNNKVLFYFTADGRVDFRELVKDLASVFKTRIELRQIGVRDETKILGGIGFCGRPLCCHTYLSDFAPVSIKMAKEQNLSLNPTKISGICGRLMCCLKYENDLYAKLKKGLPNVGERVKTPDGNAVVVDTNILESSVKTRLVLEEASPENDNEEKLSTEFYVYDKEEIRRQNKSNTKKKGKSKAKAASGNDGESHGDH